MPRDVVSCRTACRCSKIALTKGIAVLCLTTRALYRQEVARLAGVDPPTRLDFWFMMLTQRTMPMLELRSVGNALGLCDLPDNREDLVDAIDKAIARMRKLTRAQTIAGIARRFAIEDVRALLRPNILQNLDIEQFARRCASTSVFAKLNSKPGASTREMATRIVQTIRHTNVLSTENARI